MVGLIWTMAGKTNALVDFTDYFTEEAKIRHFPALRDIVFNALRVPGIIGLHGGLPPNESFPIESISLKLRDGSTIEVSDPAQVVARYTL